MSCRSRSEFCTLSSRLGEAEYSPIRRASRRFVSCALGVLFFASSSNTRGDDRLDHFEKKIRPVLVKHCQECHSYQSKELGGKLRLDSRAGILRGGESGPALVAGRPNESLIIAAMRWTEGQEMPPDDPLPATVVQDFVEWIEKGAVDPRTGDPRDAKESSVNAPPVWSFAPIQNPELPRVEEREWPRDAIDAFVLSRLESKGIRPNSDADADTLIQRLYFDLIGLAPSHSAVEEFRREFEHNRNRAIENLVDRLLASPRYGERWGRHWLDVARYGESNGNDGLGRNATFPHAWRYRDYVIDAFNDDIPYDRFVTEQIAGDLLEARTVEDRHRQLTATGFLAIGAKPAAAMNQNFAMDVVDDQINVVSTAIMGLSVSCARCHDHKHDPISTRDYYGLAGIFASTETMWGKAGNVALTAPATPLHVLWSTLLQPKPQSTAGPVFAKSYGAAIDALSPRIHDRLDRPQDDVVAERGVQFSADGFARVDAGRFRVDPTLPAETYSLSFWFRNDIANTARPITAYLFSHAANGGKKLSGDHLGIGGRHDPTKTGKLFVWNGVENGQTVGGSTVITEGIWNHVVVIRSKARVRVYLNGESEIDAEVAVLAPENREAFVAARSDNFAPLKGQLAELVLFDRSISPSEAQQLYAASGMPPPPKQVGFAMGVRDKAKVSDCKVNIDGNSKKLGPLVPRNVLTVAHSQAKPPAFDKKSSGRLQLAAWLTRRDHPQTARVFVNRTWLHLFGRGIVTTPDDFGRYGARPSHPELLDHLATRFADGGWSIKQLIRTIVLTRTYQLSSSRRDRTDSENRLFGRHSARWLDAESLRDRILQASGELELKPFQGSKIRELDALINWPPGEAKYLHTPSRHRSVFLCMLRDSPPPELMAFGLPGGFEVRGKRVTRPTPAQALFLLNSPFVVDQSRRFAVQLLRENGRTDAERIRLAYQRALQRDPTALQLQRSLDYVRSLRSSQQENSEADSVAVWTAFCQTLLASNEFRYVD